MEKLQEFGTVVHVLRNRAMSHPELLAIQFLGDGDNVTTSFTYGELDVAIRSMAAGLQRHTAPGDRVMLMLDTGPEYVVSFFACLYAGLIAVPAYAPMKTQPQALQRLLGMLGDAEASLVLIDPENEPVLKGLLGAKTTVALSPNTCRSDESLLQEGNISETDIAFLQYTSGSTSTPKGVMVRHKHLFANSFAMAKDWQITSNDSIVSWLPLYHDMGLIWGLIQPLFSGITLTLMSPQRFSERPRRWLEAIARCPGTVVSGGPDFAYRLCVERIRPSSIAGLDLSGWRLALNGAEPVRPASLDGFLKLVEPLKFNPATLYPCYGLAEATLYVSSGLPGSGALVSHFDTQALAKGSVERIEEGGTPLVACGTIATDHEVWIVDPIAQKKLPATAIGEIWVKGPSITDGYWRRPDVSQATMQAYTDDGVGPFMRTGDLGFLFDDQLYLNGRHKDLIIIRGRNFYPQDIEAVIENRVENVRAGRVVAFSVASENGESIGIAAEVPHAAKADAENIIGAIQSIVAEEFGEPVAAIALLKAGTLPKTTSGKLQRSACRTGWMESRLETVATYQMPVATSLFVPPATLEEHQLAKLWEEILEQAPVGRHDNFFARGGQSLAVTQLASRVIIDLGVDLPLVEYFQARDLADLATRISAAPTSEQSFLSIHKVENEAWSPASYAQHRLWFLQNLETDSNHYHVAVGLRFQGKLDEHYLQLALDTVLQRHSVLRTAFKESATELEQHALPVNSFHYDYGNPELTSLDNNALATNSIVKTWMNAPFDLTHGRVVRGLLIGIDSESPVFILAAHHIAIDGWSLKILMQELASLYSGETLNPLPLQYSDFARWQQTNLQPKLAELANAWTAELRGAPAVSTLPPEFSRPLTQSHQGASLYRQLPAELINRLDAMAQTRRCTLYMALFAAYAATLAESAGQFDIVVGIDIANRHYPGVAPLIGFFVNQLPLRCQLQSTFNGSDLLVEIRQRLLDAYTRQDLPFDKLVEALRPPRELSYSPVFQTKFVLQDAPSSSLTLGDVTMQPFAISRNAAELDLLFDLARHSDGSISLCVEYATDLYRAETITRFIERFVARLEALSINLETPLFGNNAAPRRPIARRAARVDIVDSTTI